LRRFHAANVHAPDRNHVVKLYERGLKLFFNRDLILICKTGFIHSISYFIDYQFIVCI